MLPFDAQREAMVNQQLVARGIHDARVLEAMRRIPRHLFIPAELQDQAYEDHPVTIGCHQTISQPYMVALMTELLALQPHDKVLEIGTGSGYQTAVLAALARYVVTLERYAPLAERAQAVLTGLGIKNVEIHVGDGTLGYPEKAPYDAILVTAAAPRVPDALLEQLAVGGRLLCPVGARDYQKLLKVTRDQEGFHYSESIACVFVPLVGRHGWEEDPPNIE